MNQLDFINTERLQWSINDAAVSVAEVARAIGVNEQRLHEVLSGKSGLTFRQIGKVADFLGRGVFFFLQPGVVPEEKVHSANFRTLTNQKPYLSLTLRKLIERIEFQRERYLGLLEELREEVTLFSPPALSGSIRNKAAQVRSWLELGDSSSFESYREALERQGILVFRTNGYKGKWQIPNDSPILGLSLFYKRFPVIVVKKLPQEERQSFTLMHELGHLLLHQKSRIDEEEDFYANTGNEYQANQFAGRVLVPDNFLERIDLSAMPEDAAGYADWLQNHKKAWGVSVEVILRRLLDAGKVSEKSYQAYRHWLGHQQPKEDSGGSRKYRYREPVHIFGQRFVRTVLDASQAQVLTLTKASDYLDNLKIKDVHQLARYVAGY